MQKVLSFLGTSFIALSFLSANPIPASAKSCPCENCECTSQKHCGCLSSENIELSGRCGEKECGCEQKSDNSDCSC